jgi:hypothetical protein
VLDTVTILSTSLNAGTTSGKGIYKPGTKVKLTASSKAGYEFLGWTERDTVVSKDSTCSFIVSSNRTIVANFIWLPSHNLQSKIDNFIVNEVNSIILEKRKLTKKNSEIAKQHSEMGVPLDNNLDLYVKIRVNSNDALDKLKRLGCELVKIGGAEGNIHEFYMWIPFDSLESVSKLENVLYITSIGIATIQGNVYINH